MSAVEVISGVVGAVVGAVLGFLGSYLLYQKQDKDREEREAEEKRERQEREAALAQNERVRQQVELVRDFHMSAYDVKTWLERGVRDLVTAPNSPADQAALRVEATRRSEWVHHLWDLSMGRIEDSEVQKAISGVDVVTGNILSQVIEGNLTVDIKPLREELNTLRGAANRQLNARL